ncbi:MAG: hypothetical protein ACYDEV_17315, partial [Acidiferrobacter sp.]
SPYTPCVGITACDDPFMNTPLLRRRPLCPDLSLPADLHPVLARVYAARVQDASALSLTWDALPSFST